MEGERAHQMLPSAWQRDEKGFSFKRERVSTRDAGGEGKFAQAHKLPIVNGFVLFTEMRPSDPRISDIYVDINKISTLLH